MVVIVFASYSSDLSLNPRMTKDIASKMAEIQFRKSLIT